MARGVQLSKELSFEVMRAAAAQAQLDKFWADTFLTNAGINSGTSTGYTYRGASNYDVIKSTSVVDEIPTMSSATAPSGVVSSSSDFATYDNWRAFDDVNVDKGWLSNGVPSGGSPQWLKYDFGSSNEKTIVEYAITEGATNVVGYAPRDWTFQGSNDDSAWTTLDTRTAETFTASQRRTFSFSNSTAYRYYRILITAKTSGGDGVEIGELEMMEAAPTSAVIKSITLTMPSAITSAIVWANTSGGDPTLVRISTDSGSTWTTIATAQLGQIVAVPSGTGVILEVTISGAVELESWGVAGV